MLKLAVKASLPLISIRSDDPVNTQDVLESVIGKETEPLKTVGTNKGKTIVWGPVKKGSVWLWTDPAPPMDYVKLYFEFMKRKATLILVNPINAGGIAFDAGRLEVPIELIQEFVSMYAQEKSVPALVEALRGLTFKEITEVSALAMAGMGEFTPRAIHRVRKRAQKLPGGLQPVETKQDFYQPTEELEEWLAVNGVILGSADSPSVLVPRGLLFTGPPGTGKTAGVRYVARKLSWPLYKVEMSGILSKYHGESDQKLREVLEQADNASPCVLLLDEVEKLFKSESGEGIVERLLAQLLWWLQEHRSRVLTIMTTNDAESIPPELYRPGRIDKQMTFWLLDAKQATEFIHALHKSLPKELYFQLEYTFHEGGYSQAELTERLMTEVRAHYVSQMKSLT